MIMIGECLPVDVKYDSAGSRLGGQLVRRRPVRHAQFRVSRASRFTDIAFPPSFARRHSDAYYRVVACVPIRTQGTMVRRCRSALFEPWADRLTAVPSLIQVLIGIRSKLSLPFAYCHSDFVIPPDPLTLDSRYRRRPGVIVSEDTACCGAPVTRTEPVSFRFRLSVARPSRWRGTSGGMGGLSPALRWCVAPERSTGEHQGDQVGCTLFGH